MLVTSLPIGAVLPATILLPSVRVPPWLFKMPPPESSAELLDRVLLMIVAVPKLIMAPPAPLVEFPLPAVNEHLYLGTSLMSVPQPHLSHPKYRPDIDGLRAIAVLSVVGFHSFPSLVRGGFIGVDIFFVISGYLISTIIFENFEKGTFSFAEFYARRIKRIFPALLIMLVASYAFGWFALLADEYKQLGKHIAAGAGFISNIVLWNEAGYFDSSAETKPLLHLWSLGIEEQFYIVWPLLLWLAWKRKFNLLTITILVTIVSFYLNIKGIEKDFVATFYSPQTRFWELLCGSLLAWITLYKKGAFYSVKTKSDGWLAFTVYREKTENDGKILSNVLSFSGLLLLAYGFYLINKDFSFPGKWAVLPVLGTVLIISAGPNAWVNRTILSNLVAVWFGLISFPLYLWHWPLLSFARIVESDVPSRNIRIGAVFLSVLFAWLTYKFVERPIRLGNHSKIKTTVLVILMVILGYFGYYAYSCDDPTRSYSSTDEPWTKVREKYKADCPFSLKKYNDCYLFSRDRAQDVLLIGDSHADHLVPGISQLASKDLNFGAMILQGGCPPLYGIERLKEGVPLENYGETGARCSEINEARLNYALSSTARIILISLASIAYNSNEMNYENGRNFKHAFQGVPMGNYDSFKAAFNYTIEKLVDVGKKVILVYDNPIFFLPHREFCLKQVRPFRLSIPKENMRCEISRDTAYRQQNAVIAIYEDAASKFPNNVRTFNSLNYFCDDKSCPMMLDGRLGYRNADHLSYNGSLFITKHLFTEILNPDFGSPKKSFIFKILSRPFSD